VRSPPCCQYQPAEGGGRRLSHPAIAADVILGAGGVARAHRPCDAPAIGALITFASRHSGAKPQLADELLNARYLEWERPPQCCRVKSSQLHAVGMPPDVDETGDRASQAGAAIIRYGSRGNNLVVKEADTRGVRSSPASIPSSVRRRHGASLHRKKPPPSRRCKVVKRALSRLPSKETEKDER